MVYLNNNDNLYYTDEEFTILCNMGSHGGIYYIAGRITTLDLNGSGFWDNKAYYEGNEQSLGWNGYFYYINNVETTLDSNGAGFWDNKAYYYHGEQPTGWNGYFYYINNVETTLDSNGTGVWNDVPYSSGSVFTDGYFESNTVYYIGGQATTLDSNGDGEWNSGTYIGGVLQGGGGGSVNLASGLQAFYKLSDTSDSSGNNRTLTNNGGVTFASGKIGNAAVFDGSNELQVTNPIAEGAEYSIAGWVKFSNFDSLQYIFSFGNDMGVLYHNGVSPAEVIFTPSVGSYIGVGTPSAGDWHFIYASRKANGDYSISIDNGSLVTGNAGETYYGTFEIGNLLNGSIDAVGIWNRALSDAEVAELYNSGNGLELDVPNLTSGLQAFYKLSDTSDSSGYNRTLTNNGNVTFAPGKIGNAGVFDGQSYLTLEGVPAAGTNDLSVGMWMNLTSIDSNQKVVYAGGSGGFTFSVLEGILHIAQSNVADLYDFSSGAITNNSWFHVLVKRAGSVFNCYINGASVGTYDYGSVIDFVGTDYYVGAHPGPMLFVEGQIDAVGIWNRALSDAEVAELYNSGNGLELGATPNLNTLTKIQGNVKFYGKVKFAV